MRNPYYFCTPIDPKPILIGRQKYGTFHWTMAIPDAQKKAYEFHNKPVVVDGHGVRHTGDDFWDLAGTWKWDRNAIA